MVKMRVRGDEKELTSEISQRNERYDRGLGPPSGYDPLSGFHKSH